MRLEIGLLCSCLALPFSVGARAEPPVETRSGLVQGVEGDSVVAYKGIPYAAAPVGKLRWAAPIQEARWTGVRSAENFGFSCPQNKEPGLVYEDLATDEDCLTLNVWKPQSDTGKLPVMVWIHGGGFNVGSGTMREFDGATFAKRNVVYVSVNYRLGTLGFFGHPALRGDGNAGNYGLMDMIAALKWVRENIAKFGGDPANVTIFGESAGGMAVNYLMAAPTARGLFHRAIAQSAGGRQPLLTKSQAEIEDTKRSAQWGIAYATADALRALPAVTVLGNSRMMDGGRPFIDGVTIVEPPLEAFRAGRVARVPFMLGTNSYEVGLFKDWAPSLTEPAKPRWSEVQKLYDGYGTRRGDMVVEQVAGDMFMTEPTREVARAAAASGLKTYLYSYSYLRPAQIGKVPGPLHFDEVYVLFDKMEGAPVHPSTDKAAVNAMQSRWVAFAKNGVPGTDWPSFTAKDERLLEFTNRGEIVVKDYLKDRLDLLESIAESPATRQ